LSNQYFRGRRRGGLKQALDEASDSELRELRAALATRQERVAQLELELFDMRAEIASFELEMEKRLGLLQRHIGRLEKQIQEARRVAARRAQWGNRADSPDIPEDVVEQFRKTWRRSEEHTTTPLKKTINEATKEELKALYRKLAKRFHPDLVTDLAEKSWRQEQMAKVNKAYSELDMKTLLAFEENLDWRQTAPVKSREAEINGLYSEIKRLDGLIDDLERDLKSQINSDTVKLMLEASIARRAGQDLIRSMEKELLAKIDLMQSELASIS